jgi:hypothetical protein
MATTEAVAVTMEDAVGDELQATEVFTTANIVNMFFEILIAVLSILGNGMVLLVIARERRLRTVTNYCVASLATADLLVGVLGIPCVLVSLYGYPSNFYGCLILNSMIIVLTQISIFSLLVIAMERFLAIRFPFWYKSHCSGEAAAGVIVCAWVAAIGVGLLPAFGWNLRGTYRQVCAFLDVNDMSYMVYFNFFGCVLLPLLLMLGIYCYIFHVVRKQIRQIAALQVSYATSSDDGSDNAASGDTQLGKQRRSLASESRSAKWFAVVLALFALCWLPLHIINIILHIHHTTNIYVLYVAIILSHANSAMNPVLYAYANTKFKSAFRRLLGLEKGGVGSDTMDASFSVNTTAPKY